MVMANTMKSLGLDAVNITFLSSALAKDHAESDGARGSTLPLVISPRWESSVAFLCAWLETNRAFLEEMMLKYGAVLIRGFDVSSASELERALLSFQPDLSNCYRGTSPRKLEDGTTYVFSAADVPSNFPIAQHLEMSFLPRPPRALYFSCMKAPTSSGGETALCDFTKVYKELSPELRQKFLDKKIMYTRTHKKIPNDKSIFNFDVADMKGWPELFGTDDKQEVERICKEEGVDVHWKGDTFVSVIRSEAFQLHPITQEPVWFNHSQVFHWTTFPAEMFLSFLRTWDLRLLMHCIYVSIIAIVKYGLLGYKMGLNATFGDGTPISVMEMHEIRSAVHKHMVYSRWQLGDILCIDNFAVSHGRQPTNDHGRKVVVAWSDALEKANLLTSEKSTETPILVAENANVFENPQERTPESTLNSEDAKTLKATIMGHHQLSRAGSCVDFVANPAELEAAFSDNVGFHKRGSSQPGLLNPSSDFWKEAN